MEESGSVSASASVQLQLATGAAVLVAFAMTSATQNYFRSRQKTLAPEKQLMTPLEDVLHGTWNAGWIAYRVVPDFITTVYVAAAIVRIVLMRAHAEQFCFITSLIYALRALLSVVTIMPPCNPDYERAVRLRFPATCGVPEFGSSASPTPTTATATTTVDSGKRAPVSFPIAFYEGVHFDLDISGHMTVCWVTVLHVFHYDLLPWEVSAVLAAVALANGVMIVLCRCHYTKCIILALGVSTSVYYALVDRISR